ncbi:DinB family protein [Candidatus Bipolaricaulota bacterium]
MEWQSHLKHHAEAAYRAVEGLFELVTEDMLQWKPDTGSNWLTTAQLLEHITSSCGSMCKGFVSGDWGMPAEAFEAMPPEELLPPAEKFPAMVSLADARTKLAADKKIAFESIEAVSEHDLETRRMVAPWDPTERSLGDWIMEPIEHLVAHKSQLFYYLKLQGANVDTRHLWGM